MIGVALAILWLAAAYLACLGIVGLIKPDWAHHFLSGFAQTVRVNWVEAILRFVVGSAMVIAAPVLPYHPIFMAAGWFLMLTAAVMPLMPHRHRRFAAAAVARVSSFMRLISLAALAGGIVLGFILSTALEQTGTIPHID